MTDKLSFFKRFAAAFAALVLTACATASSGGAGQGGSGRIDRRKIMSSTRRTTDPESLQQGRYASDPDFVELRGIEATAALLKAKTVSNRERQLIFFLQSRSLEEGGLDALVEDILGLVPEHFRTETMRRNPIADGEAYSGAVASDIRRELARASSIRSSASAPRGAPPRR